MLDIISLQGRVLVWFFSVEKTGLPSWNRISFATLFTISWDSLIASFCFYRQGDATKTLPLV